MADDPKARDSLLEWGVRPLTKPERDPVRTGTSAGRPAPKGGPRPPAGGSAVPPPSDRKK